MTEEEHVNQSSSAALAMHLLQCRCHLHQTKPLLCWTRRQTWRTKKNETSYFLFTDTDSYFSHQLTLPSRPNARKDMTNRWITSILLYVRQQRTTSRHRTATLITGTSFNEEPGTRIRSIAPCNILRSGKAWLETKGQLLRGISKEQLSLAFIMSSK